MNFIEFLRVFRDTIILFLGALIPTFSAGVSAEFSLLKVINDISEYFTPYWQIVAGTTAFCALATFIIKMIRKKMHI